MHLPGFLMGRVFVLSPTSFARQMPLAIASDQRLAFDALAFAINAIQLNYLRMRETALQNPPWNSGPKIGDIETLTLFDSAWAIIDHAHTLRLLFNYLCEDLDVGEFASFNDDHQSVRKMRNKMDHVVQNIHNIANGTRRLPPVHGALSYFIIDVREFKDHNDFIDRLGYFDIVSHMYGALTHAKHEAPVVNPMGRELEWPVGAFQLPSFGITVDISRIYRDTIKIENCIENQIRTKAYEMLEKEANEAGAAIEQFIELGAVGIHVAMRCQLGGTSPTSPAY
jgi:hypothetical protein